MIVVLDANVLYPPSLRDRLLTLAASDAFDIRWSDQILDEVVRNVIEDHPDLDAARFVDHTIGSMCLAFPDASVPAPGKLIEVIGSACGGVWSWLVAAVVDPGVDLGRVEAEEVAPLNLNPPFFGCDRGFGGG